MNIPAPSARCASRRRTADTNINYGSGPNGNCAATSLEPYDYAGCPVGRQATCETAKAEHYAACMGPVTDDPMNGTVTLTASSTGAAANQVGVALLGTTVNITETPFDLAAAVIPAGEYVIASHVVNGAGISASTILDGGSNGTNWDYRFEVTAANSDAFTVEATLYRITANDFSFAGCAAGDLANVTSGSCVGTVTCTDTALPCRNVDGVQICEAPSPARSVPGRAENRWRPPPPPGRRGGRCGRRRSCGDRVGQMDGPLQATQGAACRQSTSPRSGQSPSDAVLSGICMQY